MISQEVEERLVERLVNRVDEVNSYILQKIGNAIKEISVLTPSQAYQVGQILKYGGDYEKIVRELAKVSGKNVQEIYQIFDRVAENDKEFAKKYYRYRGIEFVPYDKDIALRNQIRSIANVTAGTYQNISNTTGIGYLFEGLDGQLSFKNIQQSYYEIIDRAVIGITQGKETFQSEMRRIMKQLGNNGLVMYESGRTRRLDSAVRMNLLDGIRQVSNETTRIIGKEYDADGIEISVHENPAPDHADIQGRQFSIEEYDKLQNGDVAKDYKGNKYDGSDKRHIGEYNCYHKIFNIILGVNEPEYTEEQLTNIQESNLKGFEFEGKHYTNYERNAVTEKNRA